MEMAQQVPYLPASKVWAPGTEGVEAFEKSITDLESYSEKCGGQYRKQLGADINVLREKYQTYVAAYQKDIPRSKAFSEGYVELGCKAREELQKAALEQTIWWAKELDNQKILEDAQKKYGALTAGPDDNWSPY